MRRTVLTILIAASVAAGADKGTVLRSIVLPGWGQMHAGHSTRGAVFMGLEASIWTGVGLSYLQGVFNRDDFRNLAMEEAGIDVSWRNREFQDDVGKYSSSSEYNDYIRSLARALYPDDLEAQREYYENHARYGSDSWNWAGSSAREEYTTALRDSREWFRRTTYVAAFALVNRAVSAIDASLLDPSEPGIYTDMSFPESADFSSVRFTIGARF
ncbi:hypothetical protein CSA37_09625 [Candidatus Fermentibacteria bacterium]|nr:MAG: hypothetical protein CSA37_09625 [Candidatus Fermentibacteria bacterium]